MSESLPTKDIESWYVCIPFGTRASAEEGARIITQQMQLWVHLRKKTSATSLGPRVEAGSFQE
jgi:hypothetical protein